ncbi:MAG: cob(I)yrinic acid a,c-diamide adenosyltransferase [bacterium]
MSRIYTKTGDSGLTGLIGGQRIPKDSLRIEAFGTLDELNSYLGLAAAHKVSSHLLPMLLTIQQELFDIGAELAQAGEGTEPRIKSSHVQTLEQYIDDLDEYLPPLARFIIPGGSKAAATLHVVRTVCRRAERRVVALQRQEKINPQIVTYLNRLSDLLFVMARFQNQEDEIEEVYWKRGSVDPILEICD